MDLQEIFSRFVGREIPLASEEKKIHFRGGEHDYTEFSLADENDPTVKEMEQVAAENGLELRILWLGALKDGSNENRVNVHLKRDDDQKWRVTDRFDLG